MNAKQYSITVTTGLLNRLNDAEIESVLGHELTHIRNGDVRMMVIAVIIAGVVSFFVELIFRLWFYNGFSFRGSRSTSAAAAAPGAAILIAVGLLVVAYVLSFVIRLALSRSREFLADAGSVELTKNPDAMISALRKIEGRGELPGATSVGDGNVHRQSARGFWRIVRHPSERRQPRRGAGQVRRRPRSRPDRAAAAKRRASRSRRATAEPLPARGAQPKTAADWNAAIPELSPSGTPENTPAGPLVGAFHRDRSLRLRRRRS